MAGIVLDVNVHLMILLLLVKTMVNGIVAMANEFQHLKYVMDQVNFVTQAGVLTVLMAQMKA